MPQANPRKRLFFMLCLFSALFLALTGRLIYWQIYRSEDLQQMAAHQWTRSTSVAATRGRIIDSTGFTLAQSGTAETVMALPGSIPPEEKENVARKLSELLNLDYDSVLKKVNADAEQVYVKRLITTEQSTEIRLQNLPGVDFSVESRRYYPMKELASQVIGYTNIDGDGQEGLEAGLNKELAGTDGSIITEKDGRRNEVPYGAEKALTPVDGCDVELTLNAMIQSFLDQAVQEACTVNNAQSAQGIVMDPATGQVLAMSTKPGFDLNDPPRSDGTALRALSRNRVISDSYEPGSVFKIITLASALEEGKTNVSSEFDCKGYEMVDGERIKCWRSNPHGHETLAEGVQNSCNPVFMQLALSLGKDTFYKYIYNFGFDEKEGIELAGEASGIVQHQKYVKNVDLARIGFGQSIAVTPLQMATAVSAAVNGGNLMKPYIVKRIVSASGNVIKANEPEVLRRVISPDTSALVCELLEGVVSKGSGKNCYIPGMRVGGKTGTAQKYEDGMIAQGKYIASFCGFAPSDDPKVLCLITVDEPKISGQVFGSTVAAPYVRQVLSDSLKYLGVEPVYSEAEEKYSLTVTVPDVKGRTVEEAAQTLKDAGLNSTADGSGGAVLTQVPLAGSVVPERTGVLLYTDNPDTDEFTTDSVTVPDLTGKKLKDAYRELKKYGLTLTSSGSPRADIVTQTPLAGETVLEGTNVDVVCAYPEGSKQALEEQERELAREQDNNAAGATQD